MSYDTNNIMKDLDVTKPDGAAEYGSILDNAMKEVKRIMFYGSSVTAVSTYPYTVLITDNTLYCTGAGGTVAAPQLSTISTVLIEKRIVVINDSSAAVLFDPYSTEMVSGAATYSVAAGTIAEFLGHGGTDWEVIRSQAASLYDGTAYRSASPTAAANTVVVSEGTGDINLGWIPDVLTGKGSVNSVSDGTNIIRTKIINIGDWNMDTTGNVAVTHGLTKTNIRSVTGILRIDDDSTYYILTPGYDASLAMEGYIQTITDTVVNLYRRTGGLYDNVNFDSTSYNRGWITITYIE